MEKWLTDGHGHLIAATHGRATLDSAEAAIRGALAGRYDVVAAALTIGTPVLFSSVGHGSALDIAGQNRASPSALIEAIERLAGARAYNP